METNSFRVLGLLRSRTDEQEQEQEQEESLEDNLTVFTEIHP